MSFRLEQLRAAIANLAASAEQQDRHLTRQGLRREDGNDELALEFDGIYGVADAMLSAGELTVPQRDAPRPLDALLTQWSGEAHPDFWQREALWNDARWEEVRHAASEALLAFR
jgi:hypothetical protein